MGNIDPNKKVITYNIKGEIVESFKGPIAFVHNSTMWAEGYYYHELWNDSIGPFNTFQDALNEFNKYIESDKGKMDKETLYDYNKYCKEHEEGNNESN